MSESETRFYDFGEFRLDTEERRLFKRGDPVPITFRAYEVLHTLIVNSGRIMEKDDLMQIVWGDTVVEEGNLKNLVYGLRKALGDETGNSHFIQTLPKRGYRFVAPVSSVPHQGLVIERHRETEITIEEEVVTETRVKPTLALPATVQGLKTWMIGIPAVLILAVAGAYFLNLFSASKPVFALENARITPLTFGTSAQSPVISPDGKFVAYVTWDSKGKSLFVRQLASNSTLKLMDLMGSIWHLSFSHDSNFVNIINSTDQFPQGVLYQIPALGGQPRKLVEDLGSLAVSQKDGQIAFMRTGTKFFRMSSGGQGQVEMFDTEEKLRGKFQSFVWSPDGTSFIASIVRIENNIPYWQVIEFGLDGTGERAISERFAKPVTINATPDGVGVIVLDLDSDALTSKILYLPRYGDEPARQLTRDANYYSSVSMTADGKTMLAARTMRPTDLLIAPATDLEHPVTIASGYLGRVSWAKDGKLISDAIENGQTDIWSFDPANGSRNQLTNNLKRNNNPAVSPNGNFIYYTSNMSGRSQLWRMNVDGSEARQLTDLPFGVYSPTPGGEGQGVYFTGQTEGKSGVYRIGSDGGEISKVEQDTAGMFAISPDGERIAYTYQDKVEKKTRLLVRSLSNAEKAQTFDLPHSLYWTLKWSPDGRALQYLGSQDASTGCIYNQPLTGGPPSPIKCLNNSLFAGFDWSPDGTQLAYTSCHYLLDAVIFSLN